MSAAGNAYSFGESALAYGRQYGNYRRSKQDHCKNYITEESLSALTGLFGSVAENAVPAARNIAVQDIQFGTTFYQVLLRKGVPYFTETKHYGQLKHKIVVYRSRFGRQGSMQTNLHFLNGRLLHVHLCFSKADAVFQSAIHSSLEEKYGCTLPASAAFVIKDSDGNCLKGNYGMEVNLYYLSGCQTLRQQLKDEQHRQAFRKERQTEKRLRSLLQWI